MLDCWKMNPMTRPSFTDLAERLGDLLQDGTKSVSNFAEKYILFNIFLVLYMYIDILLTALYEFK